MNTKTFTFKDTGVTVQIRRVSPLLIIKLRDAFPAPKPPMQEVELPSGEKVLEPNTAHPDYIQALRDHEVANERRIQSLLLRRGVVFEWTDERRKEVQELRDFFRNELGANLSESDEEVYIAYIALGSDTDLEALLNAIALKSLPTEEGVEAAKERFKSDVQE